MSNNVYTSCNAQPQTTVNLVSLLTKRTIVYKAGLAVSSLSFILFFFGDGGLYSITSALFIGVISFSAFIVSSLVTIGVALFENVRKVNPYTYHSRKLEICLIITAILCTVTVAVLRITVFTFVWFFWSLIIAIFAILGLYVGFFLILCGNKKPLSQPIVRTVHFTAGPVQNVAVTQNYGMPLFSHQYTIQSQPLLPPCPMPQEAPPPYSLPPSYPAQYPNQVMPGYSYWPPASQGIPTAPLLNTQEYSHGIYGRPQPNMTYGQPQPNMTYGSPQPNMTRVLPSAPQCDDKV